MIRQVSCVPYKAVTNCLEMINGNALGEERDLFEKDFQRKLISQACKMKKKTNSFSIKNSTISMSLLD